MAARKKRFSYGGCSQVRVRPKQIETTKVNLTIPIEEALKLHMALLDCCRAVNQYDRSTAEGRRQAVGLTINLRPEGASVAVYEDRFPKGVLK